MKHKIKNSIIEKQIEKVLFRRFDIRINGDRPWDIQVHDRSIYRDILLKGSLGFGDGFVNQKWSCKNLDQLFVKILSVDRPNIKSFARIINDIRNKLINSQSGKRAFQVGKKHYNLGNELYEKMLGKSMGYSSALFKNDKESLTDAQYNKFDALCKDLDFKPGMKVLEIGSGWGTFAKYATEKYGVEVTSLTVSSEQKKYAENICKNISAEFLLLDYQKMDSSFRGQFDRVVSIEMIEAVGKKNFTRFFESIATALKKDGLLGLQVILGTGAVDPFISTRIFPNGLVPSVQDVVDRSDPFLRIKKWNSFGQDYDKTLMGWDKKFREHWPYIKELTKRDGQRQYDEHFYRMWRYYLLCCAGSFRVGYNDVAQIVMSKR